ncbi:hypothetical protein NQ318_010658 [Aromia moschata]|uniref:acid phosphatase n=1 Tax=Aromia moschata TaxID=1265417 RepID=A0AAV8XRP8_9CUCU|nr:hypothetical protein NQ318_010658 [Aromia moschata]
MDQKYALLYIGAILVTMTGYCYGKVLTVTSTADDDNTLLSVVQVFRHGERTPILFYPTDPYQNSSYWDGLGTGQLTKRGKQQLLELGQYFRSRYSDFLSTAYVEDEIFVNTVSGKRNLESAESFLVGLYPDQNTSSIPIHQTSPAILGSLAECLRYDLLYAKQEAEEGYFKDVNEENSDTYDYIRENSLLPVYELLTANSIWDTLNIENIFNYTLPEWTESVFPEKLTNLTNVFALSLCYTEEQQRLITGVFLNELINTFKSAIAEPSSSQKVHLYSAHDVNLACFLNTFDSFTPHMPHFASSIIFELKESKTAYYINAYYKPEDEAIPITLRGCDFNCKLEDFTSLFSDMLITEVQWIMKCFTPL